MDWTAGDMMCDAVKLVWDSSMVLKTGLGEAVVWLQNLATEVKDHIICKLDQPTITLLWKIRGVARGHMDSK